MKKLEKSKEIYESIEIPKEFEGRVEEAICQSREKRTVEKVQIRRKRVYQWAAGMAAAFAAVVVVGLNTSEAFAMEMQNLPVIGELAKILTVRSYEKEEENIQIDVEIPGVELGDGDQGLSTEVNAQIEKMVRQYESEALERAKEYRTAFLETGGTEKEWAEHEIRIRVWYEIKSQTEDVLSFVVKGTESWTSAYTESRYYNLDLKSNEFLSLADLLGEDYISRANESIRFQIQERTQAGDMFFSPEEGGFETITEDVNFYVNGAGNPVIVFEKYAIAPGAMGEVEFEIGEELSKDTVSMENGGISGEMTGSGLDNFDANMEDVEAFALAVKDAVAQEDLEKLADLTGFPVYVGLEGAGIVETREEFLALDPEAVFSKEMKASMEKADPGALSPSMAGFILADDETERAAAITFGLVDGEFQITGINY